MSRHSISQIFESRIPHHQDRMISTLQPCRPRIPPPNQSFPSTPLNQQPSRPVSSSTQPFISAPSYHPPRTQIEAMPPLPLPLPLPVAKTSTSGLVRLDPSIRHPVFFTERLKKAPTGVGAGGGNWASPVAEGYVYNDGVRRSTVGGVNL